MKKKILTIITLLTVSGCATNPRTDYIKSICDTPQHVSNSKSIVVSIDAAKKDVESIKVNGKIEVAQKLETTLNDFSAIWATRNDTLTMACRFWADCEYDQKEASRNGLAVRSCQGYYQEYRMFLENGNKFIIDFNQLKKDIKKELIKK